MLIDWSPDTIQPSRAEILKDMKCSFDLHVLQKESSVIFRCPSLQVQQSCAGLFDCNDPPCQASSGCRRAPNRRQRSERRKAAQREWQRQWRRHLACSKSRRENPTTGEPVQRVHGRGGWASRLAGSCNVRVHVAAGALRRHAEGLERAQQVDQPLNVEHLVLAVNLRGTKTVCKGIALSSVAKNKRERSQRCELYSPAGQPAIDTEKLGEGDLTVGTGNARKDG